MHDADRVWRVIGLPTSFIDVLSGARKDLLPGSANDARCAITVPDVEEVDRSVPPVVVVVVVSEEKQLDEDVGDSGLMLLHWP